MELVLSSRRKKEKKKKEFSRIEFFLCGKGTSPQFSHLIPTEVLWGISSYHSLFTNKPRESDGLKVLNSRLGNWIWRRVTSFRYSWQENHVKVVVLETMHTLGMMCAVGWRKTTVLKWFVAQRDLTYRSKPEGSKWFSRRAVNWASPIKEQNRCFGVHSWGPSPRDYHGVSTITQLQVGGGHQLNNKRSD